MANLSFDQPIEIAPRLVFVAGALNSALYDLAKRKIFWLDAEASQAIMSFISDADFAEVARSSSATEAVLAVLSSLGYSLTDTFAAREYPSAPPDALTIQTAWLELGRSCNHRCAHCYSDSGSQQPREAPVDFDMMRRAIVELETVGVRTLSIVGGEPLIYASDLLKLLEFARSRSIQSLSVHTNGTLLTEPLAASLARLDVTVAVSVYGHDANVHEAVTGVPGSFAKTLLGLDRLLDAQCSTSINLIVTSSNEHVLEAVCDFFNTRYPSAAFGYDYVRPVGRALSDYRALSFRRLNRYQQHHSGFSGVDDATFVRRHFFNACLGDKLMITSDGSVHPCIMTRSPTGSLTTQSLSSVIRGDAFRQFREAPLRTLEVCGNCEFRYACSDCRPIAIGLTGNARAKPPECAYDPFSGVVGSTRSAVQHSLTKPLEVRR